MGKHLLRGFGFAAAAALLAGPSAGLATAGTVTGTTTGVFTSPSPTGGKIVTQGVGTSLFKWGKPGTIPTGQPNAGKTSDPNWMQWEAASSISTNLEEKFLLGKLTFFNGTVELDTYPDSVKLSIGIDLTAPEPVGQTFDFTLGLETTPNHTPPRPDDDADYVYFPSSFPGTTFTIDGVAYTLKILGFDDFGGDKVISANPQEFHVKEQGKAWANLYGMLTADFPPPPSVPEPASMVSAATAGLIGLGLLARRRRKAARG